MSEQTGAPPLDGLISRPCDGHLSFTALTGHLDTLIDDDHKLSRSILEGLATFDTNNALLSATGGADLVLFGGLGASPLAGQLGREAALNQQGARCVCAVPAWGGPAAAAWSEGHLSFCPRAG